jgi:TorA maturation chaperone TorD
MLDDNSLSDSLRDPMPDAAECGDDERAVLLAKAALWAASCLIDEVDRDGVSFYRTPENQDRFMAELSRLGADRAVLAFRPFFDAVSDLPAESLLAGMAEDFSKLFIGPGPGLAPPFESLYVGAGRYGGTATSELENALARAGLQQTGSPNFPGDHLAVELALLAHWSTLGERAECGWLLREHLLTWVPRWAEDVRRHSATHFYRALAALVEDIVRCGQEFSE